MIPFGFFLLTIMDTFGIISSPTRTTAEQSATAASRRKVGSDGNPRSTEHGKPQAVYARGRMSTEGYMQRESTRRQGRGRIQTSRSGSAGWRYGDGEKSGASGHGKTEIPAGSLDRSNNQRQQLSYLTSP